MARVATTLTTLLGIVATLVVTISSAVVLLAHLGEPARETTAEPQPTWQVLRSSYAEVRVPPVSRGWSVPDPDGVLFYADRRGEPVVGVEGPAVLDDGYCERGDTDAPSHRAFVGITPPVPDPGPRAADRRLQAAWTAGIAGTTGEPLTTRRTTVRLADGSPAAASRTTIRLHDRDPCTPSHVELHLVSTRTGDGVVSTVLVRDLGPRSATDETVRRILMSLRAL
ncbi:hypothetical protein [Nocardioides sp.]|uniref:hypothetical protein n=1 Tax=Nocardioides sp. TaxID=35761 RepID=UPI00286C4DAB|nr:hypothetical protein [Nocardioides sp.]